MIASHKSTVGLSIALCLLPSCNDSIENPYETDWVRNAEVLQAEHSMDYLLNCWAEQWPDGVKFMENAPQSSLATDADIAAAILATRENCTVEISVRTDQIQVDLARRGVKPPQIELQASAQIDAELQDMFAEFWSRL